MSRKIRIVLILLFILTGCGETKTDVLQSNVPKWITEGNIKWKRVQNVLYVEGEGILKAGQLDTVWKYWREEVDTLIIGEGITELGTECLYETPLVCVKLPDTLKKIGDRALSSWNLQRVEIPENVTEIGKFAFAGCEELRSIQIPKCVTWIKESAFQGCEKLEQIELPETITRIDKFAFRDCTSLRTLTFPASLTKYNKNAINDCGSLTKIINQSSYEWEISKNGMIKGDWYSDGRKLKERMIPSQKAAEVKPRTYPITYDLNGGVETKKLPASYKHTEGITVPDTVERKGYFFAGWAQGWNYVNEPNRVRIGETGVKHLNALWVKIKLTDLGNGKLLVYCKPSTGKKPYKWEIRCSGGDEILSKRPVKGSNTVLFENLERRKYNVEYAIFDSIDDFEEESLPYQDGQSIVLK